MAKDKLSTANVDETGPAFAGLESLRPKQAEFVRQFVSGKYAGNGQRSAIAAGYSEKSADVISCALVKHKKVSEAIDATLRAEIGTKLTAQAVHVIRTILADKDAPLRLKGDMAAKVIEFSGIVERVRIEKANETGLNGAQAGTKRLAEYSREELETLVRNGAALLQAAAALPPVSSDALDISPTNQADKLQTLTVSKH